MRALVILVLLASCGPSKPHYTPPEAPPSWCRLAAGAYAFLWRPSTSPPLVTGTCDPGRPTGGSTLAVLVVEPGTAIDLEVTLPDALDGCIVDSVVLAHGTHAGGLEIALVGETEVPMVAYDQTPLVNEPLVTDRERVGVDPQPAQRSPALLAEATLAADAIRGAVVKLAFTLGSGTTITPVEPSGEFLLVAARHRIAMPAPARTFAITLRARQAAFSIAVRLTAESRDPPLRFRASADAQPVPTNLVPQAAVVLSHCKLPAARALESIARDDRSPAP